MVNYAREQNTQRKIMTLKIRMRMCVLYNLFYCILHFLKYLCIAFGCNLFRVNLKMILLPMSPFKKKQKKQKAIKKLLL